MCKCVDGYSEVFVRTIDRTECEPNNNSSCPLLCNQGHCVKTHGQPECQCPPDFEGVYCEKYRCSGYCKNRGTCFIDGTRRPADNYKPTLRCLCPAPWTGERCETPIVTCHEPCQNGGTCAEADSCVCTAGYRGQHCEQCEDLQCENGGVCRKDKQGEYSCCQYSVYCCYHD